MSDWAYFISCIVFASIVAWAFDHYVLEPRLTRRSAAFLGMTEAEYRRQRSEYFREWRRRLLKRGTH